MKRKSNSVKVNTEESNKILFAPAVAESKDFTKIYKFVLEYYKDRDSCPALLFMDYGAQEPMYIKNIDGAEAIIVNRNSERLYEDIKRTVRKPAALYYYAEDLRNVWDPDVDYQDDDDEEYDIPEEDDYEEDETDSVDGEDDYPEAFSPNGEE